MAISIVGLAYIVNVRLEIFRFDSEVEEADMGT